MPGSPPARSFTLSHAGLRDAPGIYPSPAPHPGHPCPHPHPSNLSLRLGFGC